MNVRSLIFILLCFEGHLCYGLPNNPVDRIIGGTDTDIKEVPYMLSLKLSFGDNKYQCGAAIINERWAVTAAHCFYPPENLKFLEGTLCSGSSKNIFYKNCTAHKIVKVVIHENYDIPTFDYDIAVIQVTPAFSYNDYTKAVGLPSTSNMQNKEWGKVCGWGYYQKYYGQVQPVVSENLKCALVPRMECPKTFKTTPRMICYGYQRGGVDSCQGDSGGPMTNDDNILIGITSWGKGCAVRGYPGVYTNVILFLDWIKKNTVINA